MIYDRWGNLIQEKRDLTGQEIQLWDGTFNGEAVDSGTFVYYLEFTDISGRKYQLGGSITVLR